MRAKRPSVLLEYTQPACHVANSQNKYLTLYIQIDIDTPRQTVLGRIYELSALCDQSVQTLNTL